MSVAQMIDDREEVKQLLGWAIRIELSTIPPYATAAYTISQAGQYDRIMPAQVNAQPMEVIRQVMVEEMLHMTLAANILNALGGEVVLNSTEPMPGFPDAPRIPVYPCHILPSGTGPKVHLRRFTKAQVHAFREIERAPENFDKVKDGNCYAAETIGGFYHCVRTKLEALCRKYPSKELFCGDPAKQVHGENYWGAGGEVFPVTGETSAIRAIRMIVEEGEGADLGGRAGDGDPVPDTGEEDIAHFFKFNEILLSRYYSADDKLGGPATGPELVVDWTAVAPMRDDPKPGSYRALPEVQAKMDTFNRIYTDLLLGLHDAFNGNPSRFTELAPLMMNLRYAAQALVRIPVNDKGETAGPSWTFLG